MTPVAFSLAQSFVSLDGVGRVARHDGGAAFWSSIATRSDLLPTLVALGRHDADWDHWEVHPAGDEILFLVEGEMTLIVEQPGGGEVAAPLHRHEAFVVPAGAWHRALAAAPSLLMSITCGAGTRHKPVQI